MSEKLPQESQNEEVDLGQLFNAIGRLFEKLFAFIGKIFKSLSSLLIYAIKPFIVNFKIVGPLLLLAFILGYVYEKYKEPVYFSEMVVRPYFDSKYQLSDNIYYFNELIGSRNFIELSEIFEIDTTFVKELKSFELEAGPETPNDLFLEYDEYTKDIDTAIVDEMTYKEFLDNRILLSGSIFTIRAKASTNDIFSKLDEGFRKTFENKFSKYQKEKRDTLFAIERRGLSKQLSRLDSIQKVYLTVLKNESENSKLSLGIDGLIPLKEEKSITKEYDLFTEEQQIRRSLSVLDKDIAEENTYFDLITNFSKIGRKDSSISNRYSIIFPILLLAFMFLVFLGIKVFKFIKEYEE